VSAHAKLCPPSGWDRWSVCTASVDLQTGEGSVYADEGTAAHLLAATALKNGTKAEDYIGMWIWVPDHQGYEDGEQEDFYESAGDCPLTGRTFEIDKAMADPVQDYIDQVLIQEADYIQFETKVPIGHITGEEDATGTADTLRVHGTTLAVHDLKFGQGKQVYAKDNGQLMLYLLGGIKDLDWLASRFDRFEIHIHQPRLNHHDVWEFDEATLVEWAKKIRKAGHTVTVEGRRDFQPDQEACRFCDYRDNCSARTNKVRDIVLNEFPLLEGSDAMTPAQLSEAGHLVSFVESWAKDIWARLNDAVRRDPEAYPEWKLTEGRGSRAFAEGAESKAQVRLKKLHFKLDDYAPRKFITAAAVEKLVGKAVYKEKFADLVTWTPGSLKLTPAADPRPAANTGEALGFADLDATE